MTKRLWGRASALFLAVCLLASLTLPAVQAAQAAGDTVTISSEKDLLDFAKNCSLDTWSQGKTAVLTADLDLSGTEFAPIPTFGGTFDGRGHTISGLRVTEPGSTQGLFRYLQPDGVVQNLTVQGIVAPGGTRSTVGGIVGDNSGVVQNCSFRGTVQGESMVGGIAGRNTANGQIISCTVSGSVSGESATGGVAGRSLGLLLKCTNNAGVNLTQTENGVDLTGTDAGAALEERAAADDETYHLLSGCSDTGGIVGWSGGVVQGCVNNGAVGYPHVGYNTGGIAGRQSGYLAGCVNNGTINGRKDVGGIVGQGEPFLLVDPNGDTLDRLQGELDVLDRLIDRAINDTQYTGDDVSLRLEAMGGFTDDARGHSQTMLDHLTDFADDNIGSVNTLVADLTGALDKIDPALEDLSGIGGQIERLSGQLKTAMDALDGAVGIGDRAMAQIRTAVDDLRQAGSDLTRASDRVRKAVDDLFAKLKNADTGSREDIENALDSLKAGVDDLAAAFEELSQALKDLWDAAGGIGPFPDPGDNEAVRDALEDVSDALSKIFDALSVLGDYIPDYDDLKNANGDLSGAADALKQAGKGLDAALAGLQAALGNSGDLSGKLGQALDQLKKVSDSSADIGSLLSRALDTISGAVKGLTGGGPTSFTPLGDPFRLASDGLFDALGSLSGEMDRLKDAVKNGGDALIADMRAINDQFQTVCAVMLDAASDLTDAPEAGLDPVIQDTSEEDIAATRDGKVADCRSYGTVEGDRNVGGVMGSMAIEFDLDPEDDATSAFSFGTTYETKAVLQGCINYGGVSAKKDCVGGLVGRMDLGTALDCQNYGPVESTGGDYVGGVAGYADASVRSCWAKSTLSGDSYIGGVAGWASRLRDCRAIATITGGAECLGAVAGGVKMDGVLSGNCFVDTGRAGVDGVSYAGRAEPVSFEAMSALEGVPAEFTAFTLTLIADGKTVARIPFLYGEDLSQITLPAVPELEGSYGLWPEFDTSGTGSDITLEAQYAPWVTLAASVELSGNLSLALAEGQFTEEAVLHVTDSAQTPPRKGVEGAVTWDVSLTGSGLGAGDVVPLRLLSPGADAELWQYQNGQWVSVDAERSGQYLLLTMEGTQGTFYLQPKGDGAWRIALPAAAGAAGAVVVLAAVWKVRKKKAARKAAQPRQEQEPAAKS